MAARSLARLTSPLLCFSLLLLSSSLVLAQSPAPSSHTASFTEVMNAATAAPARQVAPASSRQALYPTFSLRIERIFTELLQRPSALAPDAPTAGVNAQALSALLDRTRQPHAPRQAGTPAAFSLDDMVTQTLFPDANAVQPAQATERSRRRALVDSLRMAVPSDGDVLR